MELLFVYYFRIMWSNNMSVWNFSLPFNYVVITNEPLELHMSI